MKKKRALYWQNGKFQRKDLTLERVKAAFIECQGDRKCVAKKLEVHKGTPINWVRNVEELKQFDNVRKRTRAPVQPRKNKYLGSGNE